MISYRETSREVPELSYDGRNGFPTRHETVFEIVETVVVFDDDEVSRILATTTEEKFAIMIVKALQPSFLTFPPGVR